MASVALAMTLATGAHAATQPRLDQARNGSAAAPRNPVEFQNGNLGASNSHYVEGQSIPYRLVITGLDPGTHTVTIGWDVRQGGRHAIDYVTHVNRMQPHGVFSPAHAAEAVNPLAGLSGTFGAPATFGIPAPSSAGSPVTGQPTQSFSELPAAERALTIYNGTINSAAYVAEGSLTASQSETQLRISFVAQQSTIVLAWGGHIASRLDWGVGRSAAQISGSPYHTRLIDLDGKGGNQDRSVSVDAIAVVEPVPCTLEGPETACPGGVDRFEAATPAVTHVWTVEGDGTIVGSASGTSIDVRAATACSGLYTVRLRQTDALGNVTTCSRKVPIQDTTPPKVDCPADIVVECGSSIDPAVTGFPSAIDGCDPNVTITFGDAGRAPALAFSTATCATPPPIERTWTVEDACGNKTTCVQLITFVDTTPPVITCPPDAVVECGQSIDPTAIGAATASDACDPNVTITFGDAGRSPVVAASTCSPKEPIVRTWTATDACGNSSSCVQLITFVDTTPPVLTCPPDVAISCGESLDPAHTGAATATDGCDPTVTITFGDGGRASGPVLAACTPKKPIERTWTATDDCGNTTTCVQVISFVDVTPPVLTCPPDFKVECGGSIDPVETGTATAVDDCDPTVTITFGDGGRALALSTQGAAAVIERTWTATDACGNATTCVQRITVEDTTPPSITCPKDVTVACGGFTDPSSTGTATAKDDCDPNVTITFGDAGRAPALARGVHAAAQAAGDVIVRTWTATDDAGNSSSCEQIITIEGCGGGACPRTAGFWTAQCAQDPTGRTKFDAEEMGRIARFADGQVGLFTWPADQAFARFCEVVANTGSMDVRRQARRQFASLLANVAAGELDLVADNGDVVELGPSTPVACPGRSSTTVGALIAEVDAVLQSLEGRPLSGSVKSTYSEIVGCLDRINNGVGIPQLCASADAENALYRDGSGTLDAPSDVAETLRPTPNPFRTRTRIAYVVPQGTERADVAVYDVAGRVVRTLASGAASPGSHEVTWDARDANGRRVTSGVYFVRIVTAGKARTLPVVVLDR